PVFVTAAQLQAQLDQQAQGDIDNGTDGGTYLQLGSNSNLWISHDDSVSQLTLADFVLSASDPDQTLTGTEFDDQFVPYAEDANFKTGTGVDTVNAGAGNDNIEGNAGDDLLYGEEGSDNISAGQGNDTIDGGAGGEDNANYDSWQFLSQNGVSINLGAGMWDGLATGEARDPDGGIDSLTGIESISGSQYGDALRIGFAADTGMEIPDFTNDYFFSFYGHFGNDYLESVGDVYVNFAPGESEFYQDEFGNDDPNAGDRFYGNGTGNLNMAEWQFSDQDSGVQIYFGFNGEEGQAYGPNSRVFFNGVTDANGGKNNDELWGNEENNYLDGVGGNDILVGAGGNNTLRAGEGFDTAAYTTAPGGITVTGSMQDFDGDGGSHVVYDISNGYGGTDTVVNVERIEGTAFDDEMTGADTDANQRFIGGEGSDRIDGGTGSNDGIDHRYFDNGVGAAGNNGNGITVDLNPIVDAQDPNVGWGTVVDEFGFTDYVKNIERVYATANNDSLTGDAADNIFIAGEGEDFVDGGDGFDWWWSNGTEEQSVIVDLSTNTVTNDGNGFTETILNIEGVFGAGLNDTLIGNADGNNLIAFDGDDILEGLGGDDYLDGGNGADLFIFDANSGNDTIGGFNHSEDSLQLFDFLEITSATLTAADEDGLVNDTLLSIDNGSDFVTVTLLDVELTANDIILI
ncbi:MAG: calcium-binding protein, partial [Halioglobus sp.]